MKREAPPKWRHYLLGVWRRRQNLPRVADLYDSNLRIAESLLADWVHAHPELKRPVACDNWYTPPAFCRYLDQTLQLPAVGTLSDDNQVVLTTGTQRLDAFAQQLAKEHQTALQHGQSPVFKPIHIAYQGEEEDSSSDCATHRIHNFGKHRLVINHRRAALTDAPVFYISNRLNWQAPGITRIRRHRWPACVSHEEGKAEGLDQDQIRDFAAIERQVASVAVVDSLLRAAHHDPALHDKLQRQLKLELDGSLPFWRRVTQAQSLWSLALFISAGLAKGQSLPVIMAPIIRAVCAA